MINTPYFFTTLFLSLIFLFLWIFSLKRIYRYRTVLFSGLTICGFVQLALLFLFWNEAFSIHDYFSVIIITSYFLDFICTLISLYIVISNLVLIKKESFRLSRLLGLALFFSFLLGFTLSRFLIVALLMCYVDFIFLGYCIMSTIAALKKPKYDKDFIIVLGCSINTHGGLLPLLKDRTNKAIRFAWDQEIATGHKAAFVPTGGQGRDEIMSEGSAIELYLLSHGAEEDEVFPEKKSTSTHENMLFAKEVIDKINKDATVAFCTSNYHVFRSGILAKKAGLDIEGIGSKVKWYYWPNGFVREFIGFISIHKKEQILAFASCVALTVVAFIL